MSLGSKQRGGRILKFAVAAGGFVAASVALAPASASATTYLATYNGNFNNPPLAICFARSKSALAAQSFKTEFKFINNYRSFIFGDRNGIYKSSITCGRGADQSFITISVAGPNRDKVFAIINAMIPIVKPPTEDVGAAVSMVVQ